MPGGPTVRVGGPEGGGGLPGRRSGGIAATRTAPCTLLSRATSFSWGSPRPPSPKGAGTRILAFLASAWRRRQRKFAGIMARVGSERRACRDASRHGPGARQNRISTTPTTRSSPPRFAAASGSLGVHYMTPLTDGDAMFMEVKSGAYSTTTYSTQIWGVVLFEWVKRRVRAAVAGRTRTGRPSAGAADFWEPVFHGALANGYLYVPGAKGTILKLDEGSGAVVSRIAPDASWDANTYAVSPITVDARGSRLLHGAPPAAAGSRRDAPRPTRSPGRTAPTAGAAAMPSRLLRKRRARLVPRCRSTPHDATRIVSMRRWSPTRRSATDACVTSFLDAAAAVAAGRGTQLRPTAACGTQRVAVNAAPADRARRDDLRRHARALHQPVRVPRRASTRTSPRSGTPRFAIGSPTVAASRARSAGSSNRTARRADAPWGPPTASIPRRTGRAAGACSTTRRPRPSSRPTAASFTARTPRTTTRRVT